MDAPLSWLKVTSGQTHWDIDADFLRSSWTCIWDRGCVGIEAKADPDSGLGCCSVGAELLYEDEAMRIAALAATISPEHFQLASSFAEHGALAKERNARGLANTLVIDGACVFLNRPGFDGGHGCVLHAEAIRSGESPLDWKPSICWQLPLKIERSGNTATLRRWNRDDWGEDGESLAWCCTEGEQAYVASKPVIQSLRDELVALLGEDLVDRIADEIDS